MRCFAYGKHSDVQRQQQDVNSRRTAEESRTIFNYVVVATHRNQSIYKNLQNEFIYFNIGMFLS